ncbi:hypothetical protein V6N11_014422 [Hibiscus sabdariffa]
MGLELAVVLMVTGVLSFPRRLVLARFWSLNFGNPKNFGSSLRVHLNELLTQNWEVRFTWVRRECNLVADGMTKIAWDIPFGYHQFLDPPDLVKELLQQDVAAAASPNFIFFVSPCPFK